jgi:transcriptional regulator with XRE-family HTH domain
MDVRKRVGVNLQRLRRGKGLSQEELAHRARIHQTYLSGVEGGKRNPSIGVLGRIARSLGGATVSGERPYILTILFISRSSSTNRALPFNSLHRLYAAPLENGSCGSWFALVG